MKYQVLFVAATAALFSSVLATPAAKVKLNQYSSMDDCSVVKRYAAHTFYSNNDRNILYHAAPVSGRCYDLDDKTHAFFWATGGMLNPRVYYGKGCNGIEDPLSTNGRCMDKGPYNSFKMW